ncbi:hypothetical protein C0Q70_12224 [Pomacea canaliculata]|uniref:Uncharacterized protein n=1 Tax=Pomacea canaliculata TaxID=400727 RepID=A0A2T7P0Y6_POMCA|nr:hypothetical protein C0Q70_12224 [Pomacea canaliculata]
MEVEEEEEEEEEEYDFDSNTPVPEIKPATPRLQRQQTAATASSEGKKGLTVKCSSKSGSDHRDAVPTSCYLDTTERVHASLPASREYLQGLEPDLTNDQHPHHPSFDGEG